MLQKTRHECCASKKCGQIHFTGKVQKKTSWPEQMSFVHLSHPFWIVFHNFCFPACFNGIFLYMFAISISATLLGKQQKSCNASQKQKQKSNNNNNNNTQNATQKNTAAVKKNNHNAAFPRSNLCAELEGERCDLCVWEVEIHSAWRLLVFKKICLLMADLPPKIKKNLCEREFWEDVFLRVLNDWRLTVVSHIDIGMSIKFKSPCLDRISIYPMSNVDIPLYWLVYRDPYNGL